MHNRNPSLKVWSVLLQWMVQNKDKSRCHSFRNYVADSSELNKDCHETQTSRIHSATTSHLSFLYPFIAMPKQLFRVTVVWIESSLLVQTFSFFRFRYLCVVYTCVMHTLPHCISCHVHTYMSFLLIFSHILRIFIFKCFPIEQNMEMFNMKKRGKTNWI